MKNLINEYAQRFALMAIENNTTTFSKGANIQIKSAVIASNGIGLGLQLDIESEMIEEGKEDITYILDEHWNTVYRTMHTHIAKALSQ